MCLPACLAASSKERPSSRDGGTILSMFDLELDCGAGRTKVAVRPGMIRDVGSVISSLVEETRGIKAVVVTDTTVGWLYSPTLQESLAANGLQTLEYRIEPGEASKSLTVVSEVHEFLARHAVGRDSLIVALGGGVVSDLAGFVASTWMRGVRHVICPTTMEADVDASLGGKTAVNVPGGKNLVGTFHHPILVAIDPKCLETLDARDIRAGLAESVKHALLSPTEFLAWHEANAAEILNLDGSRIRELILENLRIKAGIVERDPQEQSGVRMHLNLGHTIGHAIEECCGFTLRHGECVSLGLVAACRLSRQLGLLDATVPARVEALLEKLELPTKLTNPIAVDRILATIRADKKARRQAPQFVLLEDVGCPVIRDDIPVDDVRNAFESLLS